MKKSVMFRLAAVVLGMATLLVFMMLGELAVRTFTDVQFFGNSSNLFTTHARERIRVNRPSVHAISFGEEVFTDRDGYRVPAPDYVYPTAVARTVLFLGDSVAFGPGVPEPQTFVGLLRKNNPNWAVYNSAVVGYCPQDYEIVLDDVLAKRKDISDVVVILALNDVTNISALHLPGGGRRRGAKAQEAPPANWVERLRRIAFFDNVNAFLRDRSKLYLYVKNRVSDLSRRYFLFDLQQYRDKQALADAMGPLERIASRLRREKIGLTIVIAPMEYQLRDRHAEPMSDVLLPQRILADSLSKAGLGFVDAFAWFGESGRESSTRYYVRFDPYHFSAKGHEVVYRGLKELLKSE